MSTDVFGTQVLYQPCFQAVGETAKQLPRVQLCMDVISRQLQYLVQTVNIRLVHLQFFQL